MKQKHLTYLNLHLSLNFKPAFILPIICRAFPQGVPPETAAWPRSSFLSSTPAQFPWLANTACGAARSKPEVILGTGEKAQKALSENQILGKEWSSAVKWGWDWVSGQKTPKSSISATRIVKLKQKPHSRKWENRWGKGKNRLGEEIPSAWANNSCGCLWQTGSDLVLKGAT